MFWFEELKQLVLAENKTDQRPHGIATHYRLELA